MYCSQCGIHHNQSARFCEECGTLLHQSGAQRHSTDQQVTRDVVEHNNRYAAVQRQLPSPATAFLLLTASAAVTALCLLATQPSTPLWWTLEQIPFGLTLVSFLVVGVVIYLVWAALTSHTTSWPSRNRRRPPSLSPPPPA